MTWIVVIVTSASLVVLAAVAASGIGPVSSLQKTVARLADVRDELEDLRRGFDRLERRSAGLRDRSRRNRS
jgi:ubiquinone biosynthesis protein UbiJ